MIRRHRIPKPAPQDDLFYTAEDFNIGVELSLYGKVFKITGCDQFTENFLKKLGYFLDAFSQLYKRVCPSVRP